MFKNLPKRTKVLGGVAAALLVLAIGIGIWGYSTGKFKSSAAVVNTGNYIEGHVTCPAGDCSMSNQTAVLLVYSGDVANPGSVVSMATRTVSSSGYFRFGNIIPVNKLLMVGVMGSCTGGTSPLGECNARPQATEFTGTNQTKQMYFTLVSITGKANVKVQTKCVPGPQSPCGGSQYQPISGAKVVMTGPDGKQSIDYTNSNGIAFGGSPQAGIMYVGAYSIKVYATGYQTGSGSLTVKGCTNNLTTITLVQ